MYTYYGFEPKKIFNKRNFYFLFGVKGLVYNLLRFGGFCFFFYIELRRSESKVTSVLIADCIMTVVESVLLVTKISLERFFSVFFFNFNKQNMFFCIVIPT